MSVKYNEIMERLELSDAAKTRILNHVTELAAEKPEARGKIIPFSSLRRYAAAAACLAVVLLAILALPRLRQEEDIGEGDSISVASAGGIQELDTLASLSAAVGFPVEELSDLPFTPESISYSNFFGDMAQIIYSTADASVTFRKAHGDEDISGDYNEYETVQEIEIQAVSVTMKGNEGKCSLAMWQKDGFSYALSFEPGITEQDCVKLVTSAMNQLSNMG